MTTDLKIVCKPTVGCRDLNFLTFSLSSCRVVRESSYMRSLTSSSVLVEGADDAPCFHPGTDSGINLLSEFLDTVVINVKAKNIAGALSRTPTLKSYFTNPRPTTALPISNENGKTFGTTTSGRDPTCNFKTKNQSHPQPTISTLVHLTSSHGGCDVTSIPPLATSTSTFRPIKTLTSSYPTFSPEVEDIQGS